VLKIMGRTEQKNVGACAYLVKRKVKCGPGVDDARRRCMFIPVVANETIETNGGPSLSRPIQEHTEILSD
jgi:hypothetical protein